MPNVDVLHSALAGTNPHVPYAWSYADAAARTGAVGFVAGDVGKLCRQLDDDTLWMLLTTAPTWKAVGGGGGGGDSTTTDTYTNIPAPSNDGDLFLPSNGVAVYRDTGAAWTAWGPIFPLTQPPSAGWAWVNQEGATIDTACGGIYLLAPAQAGDDYRLYVRSVPGATYTVIAGIIPQLWIENWNTAGLVIQDNATGKFIDFHIRAGGAMQLSINRWNSPTSWNADVKALSVQPTSSMVWLKIQDDGTDHIFSWSADGQHWMVFYTAGRTAFLASPDKIGILTCASTNCPAGMTLVSWKEA